MAAVVATGCGGKADMLGGQWDVELLGPEGDVRCTGTVTLRTEAQGRLSGAAELCGPGEAAWAGPVAGEQPDEASVTLSFALPGRVVRLEAIGIEPSWMQGALTGADGMAMLRALRHGARLGKSLPPPRPE